MKKKVKNKSLFYGLSAIGITLGSLYVWKWVFSGNSGISFVDSGFKFIDDTVTDFNLGVMDISNKVGKAIFPNWDTRGIKPTGKDSKVDITIIK